MLTQTRLKELLHYDPITGVFTHIADRRGCRAGSVAGNSTPKGYIRITLDGKKYMAHRLAFLYMTGDWPADKGDHRDTIRSHNAWGNLRPATVSQNAHNSRCRVTNKIGLKGVSFHKPNGLWKAQISKNYKKIALGYHETPEAAHAAYVAAAKRLHGEFARAS